MTFEGSDASSHLARLVSSSCPFVLSLLERRGSLRLLRRKLQILAPDLSCCRLLCLNISSALPRRALVGFSGFVYRA